MFRKVFGLGSGIYKQGVKKSAFRKKSLIRESLVIQDVKKTLGSSDQSLIVMVRG